MLGARLSVLKCQLGIPLSIHPSQSTLHRGPRKAENKRKNRHSSPITTIFYSRSLAPPGNALLPRLCFASQRGPRANNRRMGRQSLGCATKASLTIFRQFVFLAFRSCNPLGFCDSPRMGQQQFSPGQRFALPWAAMFKPVGLKTQERNTAHNSI